MKLTGIRFRLLLIGIIPAIILTSALAYYFINNQIKSLATSLNERGDIITRQLATAGVYGVFSGNNQILQELVNTVLQEKDVVSVKISNQQHNILAQAQLSDLPESDHLIRFSAPVVLQPLRITDSSDEFIFFPSATTSLKTIGKVEITLSLQSTLVEQQSTLINSLLITISGLVISGLLAYRMGNNISLPIIKLTDAVSEIADGNFIDPG